MSLDKIVDIADSIGPQTMVSRIGKMPMEIQKTLFGPLKNQKENHMRYTSVDLRHKDGTN